MKRLEKHDIYPIARVVVFKDTILAKKTRSFPSVKETALWTNGGGDSFVNPYSKEVWDYNIEIAKEAAKLGFKEIQFDYVRFPEGFEKRADSLKYTKTDQSRVDVVSDFVQYAREELAPLGIRVSVDIFGYAASVPAKRRHRAGLRQNFQKRRYHQSDGIPKPLHGRLVRLSCTGQGSLPDHQGIHGRYPQEARGAGRAEADHPAMDSGLYRELARKR